MCMMRQSLSVRPTLYNKGSVSVLLVVILASIIFVTGAFVQAAVGKASISRQDAVLDLAGRSVLAEFDRILLERYGLFGFQLDEDTVKQRIAMYANAAYQKDQGDLYHLQTGEVDVVLAGYQLINVNLLERQITEHMMYQTIKNKILTQEVNESQQNNEEELSRVLRNETVIFGLPSTILKIPAGLHISPDRLVNQLLSWRQLKDTILVNEYIFQYFQPHDSERNEDSFFQNEVEYILYGKWDDESNYHAFLETFQLIRTSLNAAYLYSDPAMRSRTLTAAELITPGPEAAVTQAILIAGWAAAEAYNDRQLIQAGDPVPIWKTDATWAVTLDNFINNREQGLIRVNDTGEGWHYDEYLKAILVLKGREEKLARVMDLIQLNLKISYDQEFNLKDHYAGMLVKSESYETEQLY